MSKQQYTIEIQEQPKSLFEKILRIFYKHPISLSLLIFIIGISLHSSFTLLFPGSNGFVSYYNNNDIFTFNGSIIVEKKGEQLFTKQIAFKDIKSHEFAITIPEHYVVLMRQNQSVFMEVIVESNREKIKDKQQFLVNLVKEFEPLPMTQNLVSEKEHENNKMNFTLGYAPHFQLSIMKEPVDPLRIPLQLPQVKYNLRHKLIAPHIYYNSNHLFKEYYTPLNETTTTVPFTFKINTIPYWKWVLQHIFNHTLEIMSTLNFFEGEKEIIEYKRMLFETNIILLSVTWVVTLLHTLFDMLAFKNDFEFWKKQKNFKGVSAKSIILSIIIEFIIILYLFDNETNFLVILTNIIGLCLSIWKFTKIFSLNFFGQGSFLQYKDKQLEQSETKQYDDKAIKILGIICIPLCFGYALYALYTQEFKSWYSFILTTLVGFVYVFGFLRMTPQLFINYKLKSVPNLPVNYFIYKFLNTIIDDLFSFIMKMPMLHRIACFRDDIIFIIYMIQRFIYPVDKLRMQSFQWEDDNDYIKEE